MGRRFKPRIPHIGGMNMETSYIIETWMDGKQTISIHKNRAMAVREWNCFIDRAIDAKKKCRIRVTKSSDAESVVINEWNNL